MQIKVYIVEIASFVHSFFYFYLSLYFSKWAAVFHLKSR